MTDTMVIKHNGFTVLDRDEMYAVDGGAFPPILVVAAAVVAVAAVYKAGYDIGKTIGEAIAHATK